MKYPLLKAMIPVKPILILLLFLAPLFFSLSCSSAPKDVLPETPTAAEAGKFADFGNSFFNEARYAQAADMYILALDRYIRIDNQNGVLSAYNSLAKTYLAMGKLSEAYSLLQSALKILESGGSLDRKDTDMRSLAAETFNNYGEMEYARGETAEALDWFNRGLDLTSMETDPDARAVLLHNRGTALYKLNDFDGARTDIQAALDINTYLENFYELASNHYMIAVLNIQARLPEKALSQAQTALDYDRKTENSPGIAQDLFLLARIEYSLDNSAQALDYLNRAAKIFETLAFDTEIRKTAEFKSMITGNGDE